MKRFLYLTCLFALLCLVSCENPGTGKQTDLKVVVTEGESGVTELTFTVASENATACAWMCVEDGTTVPSGTDILQAGKTVFANTSAQATATNLKDNTTYVIIAAAMNEAGDIKTSAPVRMATQERPAQPAVTLSNSSSTGGVLTFKVNPVDAQKCAYKVYANNASATADDVLSTGTEVSATESTDVTIDNLADGEYFVVAAVQNGETKVLSSKLTFLINTAIPTYTINPTQVYEYYASNGHGNGKEYIVRFKYIDMKGETSQMVLDFVLPTASDYLPAGTYQLGDADAPAPKLDAGYTMQDIYIGEDGYFESGYCEVSIKDKKYTFVINLLRADDVSFNAGEMFTLTWTGTVENMTIV